MRAKDVMTRDVVYVTPGHSIRHAAQLMLERGVSGVPVIDGDGVAVGMLTEGDLLIRCELGGGFLPHPFPGETDAERTRDFIKRNAWSVADVMSSPVQAVGEATTLAEIAALFLRGRIRRAPVIDHGQVVGIVSRSDLLKGIVFAPTEEVINGDDRLRLAVLARLRQAEELIGPPPQVTVSNGIVRLSGDVRSREAQKAIRVIAEAVAGAGLEDRTRVATPE